MIMLEPLPKGSRAAGCRLIKALIVITIMLAIAVILVPKEFRMRMRANEMAVIHELQFINTVQIQYKSQFQRYATTLSELGPNRANLIPSTLASRDKDGYVFILTPTPSGYAIHANPKVFGRSCRRTFYTDQNGLIRQNWSAEPANASSPEFKLRLPEAKPLARRGQVSRHNC
jgi:type II secretory pathway pseudopilin PulG